MGKLFCCLLQRLKWNRCPLKDTKVSNPFFCDAVKHYWCCSIKAATVSALILFSSWLADSKRSLVTNSRCLHVRGPMKGGGSDTGYVLPPAGVGEQQFGLSLPHTPSPVSHIPSQVLWRRLRMHQIHFQCCFRLNVHFYLQASTAVMGTAPNFVMLPNQCHGAPELDCHVKAGRPIRVEKVEKQMRTGRHPELGQLTQFTTLFYNSAIHNPFYSQPSTQKVSVWIKWGDGREPHTLFKTP